MSVQPLTPLLQQICALQCTKCWAYLLEPPFCSQFIRDNCVTHKLITRSKFFTNLKNETGKAGMMEKRRIRERRRREEKEKGRDEEEERMIGVEDGGGEVVLGDAGTGNPGRRPRVPASFYNAAYLVSRLEKVSITLPLINV